MNAYDIFKLISAQCTFKNRTLYVKKKKQPSPPPVLKEEILETKEEPISDDEVHSLSDSENSSAESEQRSADGLSLVNGVEVDGKKKKPKKEKSEDLIKKLELEEQNRYRNEQGIKAVGRHVPAALKNIDELISRYNVSAALVETVKKCGYTEPTPVQRQAVPCMLESRQIFACAPTGSGKTAAFLVPILHALAVPQGGPRALILCPTRELAHQIYLEAVRLSAGCQLRCSVLKNIKESKVKEREATIKKSDIIVTTPNRLCYLLNQEVVNISLEKVRWLIIDEADKLFEGSVDQASDFRQQLDQIMAACSNKQRRIAMFSATHTPVVAKWCRHNMKGLINVTVGQRNAASSLVEQELVYCGDESGKLLGLRQIKQKGMNPPVLIFVQSKDRARQLFKELLYEGIYVDCIHADRTQKERDNVVRAFRTGHIWVLICTELMARGIDFRGVNLVVNYDFPPTAISYIHRVGRAGRAGQKGRAVTFFTRDDFANIRSIASVMQQSGCKVPEYILTMKQNANKRRKRQQKAPRRDDISTILPRKSNKRKLEDATEKDNHTAEASEHDKNQKKRKLENGVHKKGPPNNGPKERRKQGPKESKRQNMIAEPGNKKKLIKIKKVEQKATHPKTDKKGNKKNKIHKNQNNKPVK